MDNQEKLVALGTQDKDKQETHNTICVGNHYSQINTNNIRHEPSYKQLEVRTNRILSILQIKHMFTMLQRVENKGLNVAQRFSSVLPTSLSF